MRLYIMKFTFILITLFFLVMLENNNYAYAYTSDAVAIEANQEYTGTLIDYDSEDYYKITLLEEGNVTLSVNQKSGIIWRVSIINSSGEIYEELKTDDSEIISGYATKQIGLPKGTFFIKVENYYNAEDVLYKFSVNFSKSSYYEKEFNDSLTKANFIQTNKTYKGTINAYDDKDFYKFTISKEGNVSLSIKNKAGVSWEGHIQDSKGVIYEELITDDSELVEGYTITEVGLPKGTYYINLNNDYYSEDVPYEMKVAFKESSYYEKESNDNVTNANDMSLNKTYYGKISNYSDADFYKFSLANDGNLALSLKNLPGSSWVAYIHNSKGEIYQKLYSNDSELVEGQSLVNVGLPKGTYYIKVENDDYSIDKTYELKATFSQSSYYEKEFNNSLGSANKMTLNKNYYGAINDYYDKDIFRVTLPSDGNVILKMKQHPGVAWSASLQNGSGTTYSSMVTEDSELVSGYVSVNKNLKKGTYYLVVDENYSNVVNIPYAVSVSLQSNPLKSSQIKVTNNKGKADNVSVSGLVKGDTIKVYNASSKGTLLATQKITSSNASLSIKQIGTKSGKVYVTITKAGMIESSRVAVTYTGEQSDSLKSSQVKVTNNKGKNDSIKVSGLSKGDLIKVYNTSSKGKVLVSKTAAGSSVDLSLKQLGTKSGKVYVSITKSGMKESGIISVSYKGEQTTALKASQVKVTNNKKKNDTIVVSGLKKNDVVEVYNASKNGKVLVSKTVLGKSVTLSVKQLGTKSGKVYLAVTSSGMSESSRTSVSYKAEK